MSATYPEYNWSAFPDNLDKQMDIRDPLPEDIELIRQYDQKIASGDSDGALQMLEDYPTLKAAQFNAEKLLRIHHAILALQKFFYDSVLEKIYKIGSMKGDWTETMSSTAEDPASHVNMYDMVRYPVGCLDLKSHFDYKLEDAIVVEILPYEPEDAMYIINDLCFVYEEEWVEIGRVEYTKQYFMAVSNDINAGENPLDNPDKYLQISIKGEKGEAGYTPQKNVDYYDGASGTGMSPRGGWLPTATYYQYDLVSHNGAFWYATQDLVGDLAGVEPVKGSEYWEYFDLSIQFALGSEPPDFLNEGGLWIQMQKDGHVVFRTKNEAGFYIPLYPETRASYIYDSIGTNLQKKIYQHYFDRDDVEIEVIDKDPVFTKTATLLENPSVVVAKTVISENEDGTFTELFTTYDNTGVFETYQCKMVYTNHGAGRYTVTPEVIIQEDYDKFDALQWYYI